MSTTIQTDMTTDEFLRQHGDESGIELVNGQIRRVPMPECDHGEPPVTSRLTSSVSLVIEVRQPSESVGDVCRRATAHLRAGVRVVLVLDPETESAGVVRPNELPHRFHNGDTVTLPDVLPGFAVPVGRFFE